MIEPPERSLEILDPCHGGIPRRARGHVSLGSPPCGDEIKLDGDAFG